MALNNVMLNVYAECRNQALYAEWRYTECCYAEWRYAECRGAKPSDTIAKPFNYFVSTIHK